MENNIKIVKMGGDRLDDLPGQETEILVPKNAEIDYYFVDYLIKQKILRSKILCFTRAVLKQN